MLAFRLKINRYRVLTSSVPTFTVGIEESDTKFCVLWPFMKQHFCPLVVIRARMGTC